MWFWLLPLAVAAAPFAFTAWRKRDLQRQTFTFLQRFRPIPILGSYHEGLTRLNFGPPRADHAVLLLHGFSASADMFGELFDALEARGIPYLAPTLTGFGLDDFRLLERATIEDWRRDVFGAYDVLSGLAREVSVVAVSFGTQLAAELAVQRPVKHLVFTSPYFFLKGDGDRRYKEAAKSWFIRNLALTFWPVVAKPVRPGRGTCVDMVDTEAALRSFQYPTVPLASLLQIWKFPGHMDFKALKARTIDVVWGEQDETSDVPTFLRVLDQQGVAHRSHAFPNSAHNPYRDPDHQGAIAATMAALEGS